MVVFFQAHAFDPGSSPAHGAYVFFIKPDSLAIGSGQNYIIITKGIFHPAQLIPSFDFDGDQAGAAHFGKFFDRSFFDQPFFRGQYQIFGLSFFGNSENAGHKFVGRQFQEIESLLAAGYQVEAQGAYQDYQARFEEALHSGDLDEEAMLDDISREYVLLELLLRSNSVFYSTDAVKLLSDLEEAILSLAGSDQDLDEERQAFVQSKIRFLQNLFAYVMERKISLETATDLANELLSEAESTLASITSKVAVRDYFETKLEEFDLSIAFMNSPEFYSYDSFDIGLADYRSKEANLEDLNEYIQSLRVGEDDETVTISLEDATAEVEETLHDNSIQFATVESLGDSSYRLFEIAGARTGGIAFEANYDRETQILYDVVVGEVRFSTGLSLEMAKQVIEGTVSDAEVVEDEEPATAVEDDETPTESLAISRVEAALEAADLEVSDFAVTLVDLEENLFTLEGSFDKGKLLVSGTYDLDTGLVSEIVLESEGQSYTAEDTSLVDLETVSLKL